MVKLNYLLIYIIYVIFILISVAFVTLLEQKILASMQIRVGPKYVGYQGLLQSFADAIKLLNKESVKMWQVNYTAYMVSPSVSLMLSLMLWPILPVGGGGVSFKYSILYFMCISGVATYPIIMSGWTSNCKYSMMGSLRAVAQMISYEISMGFILLCLIYYFYSLSLEGLMPNSIFIYNFVYFLPAAYMWLVCMFAETNRTPYDFSESESELVSGYNTEFSSGGFTLLFMAEYSSIMMMSVMFSFMFLMGTSQMAVGWGIMIMYLFIWVRGTLARTRYDKLMSLAWKSLLPGSLCLMSMYLAASMLKIF